MAVSKEDLINSIVEICAKMDAKGWVANHDGNISTRFEDTFRATPTAVSKADVIPEWIITLDKSGKKIEGTHNPFSEIKLHLAAYNAREDIQAVVHAHPPFSMARGLAGIDFEVSIPEAIVSIGDIIPVVPYAFPGDSENDTLVAHAVNRCDVFMMAGNGVLSVGRDVKEAYLRMELLEHLLKIDYYARSMGTVMSIPVNDRQKLLDKRASLGLGPKELNPLQTGSTGEKEKAPAGNLNELIKEVISEEIKKILISK